MYICMCAYIEYILQHTDTYICVYVHIIDTFLVSCAKSSPMLPALRKNTNKKSRKGHVSQKTV